MNDAFHHFAQDLAPFIADERIISDPLRTLAFGTDASFYRLIPKLVVTVINEQEVQKVLELAHKYKVHLTFRAAGTSLSGQAVTDGVSDGGSDSCESRCRGHLVKGIVVTLGGLTQGGETEGRSDSGRRRDQVRSVTGKALHNASNGHAHTVPYSDP